MFTMFFYNVLCVFIFRMRALWSLVHWMKPRCPHFPLMTSAWWRSVRCSSGNIQQMANRTKTDEEMKAKNIHYSDSCPTQVNWSIRLLSSVLIVQRIYYSKVKFPLWESLDCNARGSLWPHGRWGSAMDIYYFSLVGEQINSCSYSWQHTVEVSSH